jgi:hypothetical protein
MNIGWQREMILFSGGLKVNLLIIQYLMSTTIHWTGTTFVRWKKKWNLVPSAASLERSASRPGRALPPRKGPPVPIVQEAGWAQEPVWTQRLEEKKILCPYRGSNPDRPVVQPVARHYTDWATPAPFKDNTAINCIYVQENKVRSLLIRVAIARIQINCKKVFRPNKYTMAHHHVVEEVFILMKFEETEIRPLALRPNRTSIIFNVTCATANN